MLAKNAILASKNIHTDFHLHIWSIYGEKNAITVTFFTTLTDIVKIEEIKDDPKSSYVDKIIASTNPCLTLNEIG